MPAEKEQDNLSHSFQLTPQQSSLLFAALQANNKASSELMGKMPANHTQLQSNGLPFPDFDTSGISESPFLDSYDFDSTNYDIDLSNITSSPGPNNKSSNNKTRSDSTGHEKRSHPDDEEDEDGANEDGDTTPSRAKRRESTEKVAKKPGRKPLTEEPTSKRKAQNRAAQRAFRERKEKHLSDLETKIEELKKESEAANNENATLRSQVERISAELNEYKQKVALLANPKPLQTTSQAFGSSSINDVNFHFQFPKFGVLPGPAQSPSPMSSAQQTNHSTPASLPQQAPADPLLSDTLGSISTSYGILPSMNMSTNGPRSSVDSVHYSLGTTTTSSPSASSHSNMGASSSCGTSPEPSIQSPLGFKSLDTMTTIGEESHGLMSGGTLQDQSSGQFLGFDINNPSFDWLAQQNGGTFDPQLFGDYRDPQDNILQGNSLDDTFFKDTLGLDFFTPYYTAPTVSTPPVVQKKNILAEIDAIQNAEDGQQLRADANEKEEAWKYKLHLDETFKNCDKVRNGEIDMDDLCAELALKATCQGKGPGVNDKDFSKIMKKYVGPHGSKGENAGQGGATTASAAQA